MTSNLIRTSLTLLSFSLISMSAQANLIVNGSFENRTSPPPPASGFSSGVPDNWVDLLSGNTYLVHESHPTVPANEAIDGEIIVGGSGNIELSQTFTVDSTGRLQASWWANNETDTGSAAFFLTQVGFYQSNVLIEESTLRDNFGPTVPTWNFETFTTNADFAPGTYEVRFRINGLSSADELVVTQLLPTAPAVPALTGWGLVLLTALLALIAYRRRPA